MTDEKEQLAKLKGAHTAMAVALAKIERLERILEDQAYFTTGLRKTIGTDLHANFYRDGVYKVLPIFGVLDEQIAKITKSLA